MTGKKHNKGADKGTNMAGKSTTKPQGFAEEGSNRNRLLTNIIQENSKGQINTDSNMQVSQNPKTLTTNIPSVSSAPSPPTVDSTGQCIHQSYPVSNPLYTGAMNNTNIMSHFDMQNSGIYGVLQQIQQELRQTQITNTNVLTRLTEIENNVSKLSKIENIVEKVQTDVNKLKKENERISSQVTEFETSCQAMSSMFDAYIDSRERTEKEITELKLINQNLDQNVKTMNQNYEKLQNEILELKTRSMQENLLFFGIEEKPGENTETELRNFLKNQVLLNSPESVDQIVFDRVHRLGARKGSRDKPNARPIVAKFERYTDREYVRKESFNLNREKNGYTVREQFPYETEQKRKTLYPVMRKFKANKENKVVLIRDKLFINGTQYIPEEKTDNPGIPMSKYQSRDPRHQSNTQRRSREFDPPVPLSNRFQSLAEHDVIRKTPQKSSQGHKNKARSPLEEENLKKYKTSESSNMYDEQSVIVSNVLGQAHSVLNPIGENLIDLDGTCSNVAGGPVYD